MNCSAQAFVQVAASICLCIINTVIAEPVENFSLPTHRGVNWELNSVDNSQLVVVAFLGTECPLAKLYGPRLTELQNEYFEKGVVFVGINSNTQDSLAEITAYINRHQISFPILKDAGNRIADQLKAERTPEVILLDQQRNIRYRGRIDDQYLVGLSRNKVTRRDLAIAIDEVLTGQDVTVANTETNGCHIGRVRNIAGHGDVTYANQIVRIFNKHCVECHRTGEVAPFQLTSYEHIIGWEDTILEVIADNRMPPWFANPEHGTFRNDARLTDDEKQLIRVWVKNGMPKGTESDLPEPPEFAEGWRMAEPDQVIRIRDTPFTVPAEGIVDYQYFPVDPGWTEDMYVTAAEARPDNVAVVHHIIAYVLAPGSDGKQKRDRRMLVGYAPGAIPHILDDGMAMHVPAGSQLVFEMHYTPNGSQQTDLSYIGLKFTDRRNVKQILHGGATINTKFEIPPHASNHRVEAEHKINRSQFLLDMTPHMHLRGKSFQYEALYPDGQREILLDVPRYDFNWQLSYILAQPKLLPKGTTIKCTASYDNSEQNPVNPAPNKPVRWGDQSDEEMMLGFFNVVNAETDSANSKSLP